MKNRKHRSVRTIRVAALVAALCGTNMSLYAGDHVKLNKIVRGRAYISQDGSITTIRVGKKTILNYDRFNIPAGTTLKFVQPGRNSRVLNRITGGTPTSIDGTLAANGIVYIVNPSGVMFGPDSTINVGGLYAAAGNISDADFLRGVNHFTDVQGSVVNHGLIQAEQFAHLVGTNVTNTGAIHAPEGLVSLSAGKDVYLAERGNSVMVRISDPTGTTSASTSQAALDNSGVIESDGASFTVGDVYSLAMRNTGTIKADGGSITVRGNGDVVNQGSIQAHSGNVSIDAGRGGAEISGSIDVSGRTPGARGGTVEITGSSVNLRSATVDASGDMGGGTVHLGGELQGGGDLAHAGFTSVDAASTVRADAITAGNGGTIVAWSDHATFVQGDLSARGGALVGHGGLIETSSKLMLDVGVTPDVSAPSGFGGTWLIDPNNITIVAGNGFSDITNTDPFTSTDDGAMLG
ncbi:MAG: filamentous hemagglutinin N-terminal domain-containing protein, partial [Phycisphaerales bacterium]|nr:filamentous hemagglutinin N-terminal domain-containing protein [Phycisphaerales bacterium]